MLRSHLNFPWYKDPCIYSLFQLIEWSHIILCFKYKIKVKSWLHERGKTFGLLLLGATFICMSVRDFVVCQQHNQLHSLCSNCFSDAGQGSRMILSATKGTSFHLTTCSRYCALPSSLFPLSLLFPSLLAVRLPLPSYYLCPAMHSGGGMLLSHASHAHSLVWHAAPSDNTFGIRGQGSGTQ